MPQDTCNLKCGPPGHLATKRILNLDADKRWAQYPMADQGFSFEVANHDHNVNLFFVVYQNKMLIHSIFCLLRGATAYLFIYLIKDMGFFSIFRAISRSVEASGPKTGLLGPPLVLSAWSDDFNRWFKCFPNLMALIKIYLGSKTITRIGLILYEPHWRKNKNGLK